MIAVDTSTWVAYLGGDVGPDTDALDQALEAKQVVMVPAVLTEILSDPKLPAEAASFLLQIPLTEIESGYWERAGRLRSKVLRAGRKARLGDALIAQACLDHGLSLLTRDRDFTPYRRLGGLKILPAASIG